MAYDTKDGGVGRTPPAYAGSSNNPTPRNPRCDPVTVTPGSAPTPQPVANVPGRPTINSFQFPLAAPPGGGLNRGGVKPLT